MSDSRQDETPAMMIANDVMSIRAMGTWHDFHEIAGAAIRRAVAAERKRCANIANGQYSAIDDDPEDYVGKVQHSESWKMACTRIGMLINSND